MTEPNLVLVGDSIRLSYQPYVVAALPGRRVWGPEENCESTRFLLEGLDRLVLDRLASPSLVHLNAGAHDLRRWPEGDYVVQVDLDEYRTNLAAIVGRILAHDSVTSVILATTTPVIDELHESGRWGRRCNADVLAYNDSLRAVATAHDVPVNDLYTVIESCPFAAISTDGIHLTAQGAKFVGDHIADLLSN